MLRRKFYDTLVAWKAEHKPECLLVKGARQVGKTYIIKKFGEDNYKNFIYINFTEQPELKQIFAGSLSADEIYKQISLYLLDAKITADTLLFLDEIQECPSARTALKFLAIDHRCDVIASGSLLGINYKEIPSVPVGYEREVDMYSLDFEEFLWAKGATEDTISMVREFFERKETVPKAINSRMLQYLREYIVTGGMPEVVNSYVQHSDFNEVQKIQAKIVANYRSDVTKYAESSYKAKIQACYASIPAQLAKENKKFQYSVVAKGGTARKYEDSIQWLSDANLVYCCFNVSTPVFPLIAYEKNSQYKIYLNDIGLLVSMYGYDMKAAILHDTLSGAAKGGIYENLVCEMLVKRGYKPNYYKADNNSQEIEFLITQNGSVIPIEVKAGNNATVSLNSFIEKYKPPYAYKFTGGNLRKAGVKITLPHYMVMFI